MGKPRQDRNAGADQAAGELGGDPETELPDSESNVVGGVNSDGEVESEDRGGARPAGGQLRRQAKVCMS